MYHTLSVFFFSWLIIQSIIWENRRRGPVVLRWCRIGLQLSLPTGPPFSTVYRPDTVIWLYWQEQCQWRSVQGKHSYSEKKKNILAPGIDGSRFLYTRLQTGRIMVWWCPSVRVSVRPSVTVFRTFLLHALRCWAEILCITLFWCT